MKIFYCEKCHNKKQLKNFDKTIEQLKDNLNCDQIDTNCISYCGPGRKLHFIGVNDEIIESTNFEELIEKIEGLNDN